MLHKFKVSIHLTKVICCQGSSPLSCPGTVAHINIVWNSANVWNSAKIFAHIPDIKFSLSGTWPKFLAIIQTNISIVWNTTKDLGTIPGKYCLEHEQESWSYYSEQNWQYSGQTWHHSRLVTFWTGHVLDNANIFSGVLPSTLVWNGAKNYGRILDNAFVCPECCWEYWPCSG